MDFGCIWRRFVEVSSTYFDELLLVFFICRFLLWSWEPQPRGGRREALVREDTTQDHGGIWSVFAFLYSFAGLFENCVR